MADFALKFKVSADPREARYVRGLQRSVDGKFINASFTADGFSLALNGLSLSQIPELAKISAIITGILGIFGLFESAAEEPFVMPKLVTSGPGITLAALIGAKNGLNILMSILKAQVNAFKAQIARALQSIENIFKCVLKNPLLALQLLAKIMRKGWLTLPIPIRLALETIRDLINRTFSITLIADLPMAKFILELLSLKVPPFVLLPFIPVIPGCGGGFYSGRPPVATDYNYTVDPQPVTGVGNLNGLSFAGASNLYIPVTVAGQTRLDLAVQGADTSGYNPNNPELFSGVQFNDNLQVTNKTLAPTPTNSNVRQAQDRLLTSRLTNDIAALNKDISRGGFIPRQNPLDDLLCQPIDLKYSR